ncbi:SHOCT domain-containing protein [Dorea formicigenerans]|uniref:Conjugal transfer protein n=1 Tax=Dorea formicigenerans TaxID=39486 RepID=A0A3E4PRR8_9FIRM|nr:SHOCT domain-containing protein [Dorea formicigenerans]RGK82742.1 conjugal transfer protein [Dorea formicigenerans]
MDKKLIRYSMQIAMLNQLLARKMISEKEYVLVKSKLMQDYKIVSNITA